MKPTGERAVGGGEQGRLMRLDTCAVSDALDRFSLSGAVGGFRRWGPRRRIAGRAITVALEPGPAMAGDSHLGTRALATAGSGDVVVVANAGRTEAGGWGGLLTLEAHLGDVAGIVVDGALRDADEVDDLDIPVLARAATPRTARGRFRESATNVPVVVDGVSVEPGSWVVADGSGVVFVAAAEIERVLAAAEDIATRERGIAASLRGGARGDEVMDDRYQRMLERRVAPPTASGP